MTQAHMVYDQGFYGSATLRDTALRVVTVPVGPDTGAGPQPQVGRVAWVVRYNGSDWEDDTWVDAQTGRVVGGESGGPGFGGSASSRAGLFLPLAKTLPQVRAVYVRRPDPAAKGGWAAVKTAAFTAKQQPRQADELRAAAPAPPPLPAVTSAPAAPPPDQLVLVGKDNSLGVYGYDPATGLLGAGSDWVRVPVGFQTWMQQRLAASESAPTKATAHK